MKTFKQSPTRTEVLEAAADILLNCTDPLLCLQTKNAKTAIFKAVCAFAQDSQYNDIRHKEINDLHMLFDMMGEIEEWYEKLYLRHQAINQ